MIYEKIEITFEHETANLVTYILDNSPSIDEERKRPMVVICPGGGYRHTSDREAEPIAIKLNALGFHACVLRYSVKPAGFPTALCQLAKVIGLIREKADDWNIDTGKVIVMGFSAGGHLAASLGVFWNQEFLTEKLALPSEQMRPNGMILCYPVITTGEHANQGSFQSLLGEKVNEKDLLRKLSLEHQVTQDTPPTFLWHTVEDIAVPVENSLLFASSLLKHRVPIELHIYPRGVHGLSLGTIETKAKDNERSVQAEVTNWITMAGRWIADL